jgi:ATP-dependent Lhr-like helicase
VNPYALLAEPVQSWIEAQGWTDFTAIQAEAIPRVVADQGVLLVSSTASGKTEAAVLPVVSRILELRLPPVAMLYVAPLKALINDQAGRAERILRETSLSSAWWHGELPRSERLKIVRNPPHALLTTPESLEVMLTSDGYGHGALLGNIRYVVVDEVHAFAQDERGAQLVSLLARVEAVNMRPFVRIALSATVARPETVTAWLRSWRVDAPKLNFVVAAGSKRRRIGVGLIPSIDPSALPRAEREKREMSRLGAAVQAGVDGKRALVFTNARAMAERVASELMDRGVETYVHHGSIDAVGRRRTEAAFRTEGPKTIVATSTLELGIDIGKLELTIQLGAPASASSFLQRLGRSGRRSGTDSVGLIYALSEDELPAVLAVADLASEGVTEEIYPDASSLPILFHQTIALVNELDGATPERVFEVLHGAGSFRDVSWAVFEDLVRDQVEDGFLDLERGRLQIGAETEKRFGYLRYRDFYSVFQTNVAWAVRHGAEPVGTLDRGFPISEGRENVIVLDGRKWRVTAIDRIRLVLQVEPAPFARVPRWSGDSLDYSFEVMRRTVELLSGTISPLETPGIAARMAAARGAAAELGVGPERIVVALLEKGIVIYTYAGVSANRYLSALLRVSLGTEQVRCDGETLTIAGTVGSSVPAVRKVLEMVLRTSDFRRQLEERVGFDEASLLHGKYARHLGSRTRIHHGRALLKRDGVQFARLPLISLQVVTAQTLVTTE